MFAHAVAHDSCAYPSDYFLGALHFRVIKKYERYLIIKPKCGSRIMIFAMKNKLNSDNSSGFRFSSYYDNWQKRKKIVLRSRLL